MHKNMFEAVVYWGVYSAPSDLTELVKDRFAANE